MKARLHNIKKRIRVHKGIVMKKVILLVLDSLGIGAMYDSSFYGDEDANTLNSVLRASDNEYPNLAKLGLGMLNCNVKPYVKQTEIIASYGKMAEKSVGKDTTTGHWEMAGIITTEPLATYPKGFPKEMLQPFIDYVGKDVLGNEAASGTEIIQRLGQEHIESGKLIVYTSADSVLQIAAHTDVISLDALYDYCRKARELYLHPPYQVGRIIARPFCDKNGVFTRDNEHRKDFALTPKKPNLLTILYDNKKEVIAIGKISDIFNGVGITKSVHTVSNQDGMEQTIKNYRELSNGLLFTNLVDFDTKFGHRRDPDGYADALKSFDEQLGVLLESIDENTLLIITADHGCDPAAIGSDHTREYVPLLVYQKNLSTSKDLGVRATFADIAASICAYLDVEYPLMFGESFLG